MIVSGQISTEGARMPMAPAELPSDWWDIDQVRAYLASQGRPITSSTWTAYVARGQAPAAERRFGRTPVWAPEARAGLVRKHRAGELTLNGKLTVGEWLARWLATQDEVRGLRPGTLLLYRQHVAAYLVPHLGHLRLADLRPQHVTDMLAAIR